LVVSGRVSLWQETTSDAEKLTERETEQKACRLAAKDYSDEYHEEFLGIVFSPSKKGSSIPECQTNRCSC
jgi:hypothetical protein